VAKLDVILWWHHHQPWYVDPVTGAARLPWVRLHGCRGYLDMASLAEHPSADKVPHTFNFVPSLLDQLARYGKPGASDLWLDLSRPHPRDMNAAQRAELTHRMGGQGPRPTRHLPRLDELRGLVAGGGNLPDQDLMDLQVLAHLGFMGWTLASRPGPVQEMMKKGKGFTQAEKDAVLDATVAACLEIVPRYRELWRKGRVELTVTPYFHPILPLVIDTNTMQDGLPFNARPPRFAFPQDAELHVTRAVACAEKEFGKRPAGMWPAEGSVSADAVAMLGDAGMTFCGTDEGVLYRSQSSDGAALNHGEPYLDPSGRVAMFFRDHHLSDQFGFTFREKSPHDAAQEFLHKARGFAEARAGMGRRPCLSVILDGENPWEHYPNAGREHMVAIQEALGSAGDINVVTPSQHLKRDPPRRKLGRLHAGSWVDSTFNIWIGHAEDRQGWRILGDCRREIDRARRRGVSEDKVKLALDRLMPAEGSDWFWWFGEDFQSREADLYDELFRLQVKSAYAALGVSPPPLLNEPIKHLRRLAQGGRGWPIHPVLTGAPPSAAAWRGAVRLRAADAGAMAGPQGAISEVLLGFHEAALWACIRFHEGRVVPGTVTLLAALGGREQEVSFRVPAPEGRGGLPRGVEAAVGHVVTVKWALSQEVRPAAGGPVSVAVTLVQEEEGLRQRLPATGGVEVEVPPEQEKWRAAWV
jgi:alpha-amylase/alpha-mannosidase (GH57 family)